MAVIREALSAFTWFVETWRAKYPKAVVKIEKDKDKDSLPALYEFPAEHWAHIKTTHSIESTFLHGFRLLITVNCK